MLVLTSLTVASGAITVVTPIARVTGQPLSKQNSAAVSITRLGVDAVAPATAGQSHFNGPVGIGVAPNPALSLQVAFAAQFDNTVQLFSLGVGGAAPGTAGQSTFNGPVGIGAAPDPAQSLKVAFASEFGGALRVNGGLGVGRVPLAAPATGIDLAWNRSNNHGLSFWPNADSGTFCVNFNNVSGASVGSISSSATATAYNTSSDVRLKYAVTPLPDALTRVQALRPVAFRWRADDSAGEGFLAAEVQQVVPLAVTGQADAVDADGGIVPQGMDASKLVVWLVAGMQELTARLAVLEDARA